MQKGMKCPKAYKRRHPKGVVTLEGKEVGHCKIEPQQKRPKNPITPKRKTRIIEIENRSPNTPGGKK